MKKYLFILSLFFITCQDEITLDLPNPNNQIVVEGAIEPGFPPYIILTQTQGYFDPIDNTTYRNLFIKDAQVEVWKYNPDGSKNSIPLPVVTFDSIVVYTVDPSEYDFFLGENNFDYSQIGETYYLEILWNNDTITSSTTIPTPTPLDCLWVEKSETAEKEYKCDIRAVYSDDFSIQNNILIKSKRLEYWKVDSICSLPLCNCHMCGESTEYSDPLMILLDAGSDVLINGESFETYFPKPREEGGIPTGSYNAEREKIVEVNGVQNTILLPHDVVLIKFCQIDEPSLKFWRGVVRQTGMNGNPFTEPMNLPSNINGGLGVWTGYAPVYYKIPIIKEITISEEHTPELTDIF